MIPEVQCPVPETAGVRGETRRAQERWARTPLRERLHVVRELRYRIAENADALSRMVASAGDRPPAEKLVSEILPLADACRWLERGAARVLAPRFCGKRGRPFWMRGVSFEVLRQPFGIVLVIGPGNYPLFLPAVHTLHALVAGNAVLLKPAPGTREVMLAFARLAINAGLDPALLTVLPDTVEAARMAISGGVDKVIFTGSSENGRDVLMRLAATNTPSVMELSGEDAVIVLADADLDLVARALRFGTNLNSGNTCIAPRRLIVVASAAGELAKRLNETRQTPEEGAGHGSFPAIESVPDDLAAIDLINAAEFGLGASVFSRDVAKARELATRIRTGFVVINDLIVPTADPRMPFGGLRASGFGSTRGDEGLLEMTFPHVIAVRAGRFHPHFDEPGEGDASLFAAYIRAAHGRHRLSAMRGFLRAIIEKAKSRKTSP